MAAPRWSYETPQPWEERQGTLADRVVRVSVEAQRVFAQQEAMLPTIHHEHTVDPAVGDHLQDVGKRVLILQENARKPDKRATAIAQRQSPQKRVIPSRFPEDAASDAEDEDEDEEEDVAYVQGRIETMLMDQEWDTRTWTPAKIQIAVETLYEQVELSDDARRRELATTMLLRLLEKHESAVECVEATIPILMNKALRNLSKIVNRTRMFRVCTLLAVLAEWFAPILSRNNAVAKSMAFLLRETDLCARIVQHHWRGVVLRRSLATRRDIDDSVRTRLRAMHFIKNVELRHQFKVLRDVIGPSGLPIEALRAYVKMLFHLMKPIATAVDKNRHHVATADQNRLLGSGILVVLASLIPTDARRVAPDDRVARRAITEHIKGITVELTVCCGHEADKTIEILKSNIVERIIFDLAQQLEPQPSIDTSTSTVPLVRSCLEVVAAITNAVWQLYQAHHDDATFTSSSSSSASSRSAADAVEAAFLMRRLQAAATQFLVTSEVMTMLLRVLPLARQWHDPAICALVLTTLRSLSGSFGFKSLLDALTRNGGRALEQIVLCFEWDDCPAVVRAAVALFHDMTSHPHARAGFTTAGAVPLLAKWCDMEITTCKNQPRFVLALCGIALLARQHAHRHGSASTGSSGYIVESLGSLETRLDALYAVLLGLVSGPSKETRAAAVYLHQTVGVFQSILLRFLVRVKPSDMEPAFQTRTQRSISCIVLSRVFKVPTVAAAAFSESTVVHLALSLQCNRLDEVEGKLRPSLSTEHTRRLHYLGLKEACKALSRLARCPSGPSVNVSLRPTITSGNVPLLPQAIVCDVVTRMHVLEDLLPLIHVPTDAAEFLDIDMAMAHAAIELVGYLRPMPYGEASRQHFLVATQSHPHGTFAHTKLEMLVTIAAPMVLHVLKEKHCGRELVATSCTALSRLAATNPCRSALLQQGAMFIALTHVPEVLYDSQALRSKHPRKHASSSPIRIDASVDDHGLLDVPASLFTLLAKLCAIADGRAALMKAQVLPRVLKRLQLTDVTRPRDDLDVKSEIAVLLQRLAMCNVVEGNTSELFLHFRVVELLVHIAVDLVHVLSPSPAKSTDAHARAWRVLDHVVGAIAALAQDVLVCVPTVVQLDVLSRLAPLLPTLRRTGTRSSEQPHELALQYHVVHIARAIAAFPFGEYHSYLMRVRIATTSEEAAALSATGSPLTFMDRIKKIAFDFTLELQGHAAVGLLDADEKKTIGELAREILALICEREVNEHKQREQHHIRTSLQLPAASSPSRSRPSSLHVHCQSQRGTTPIVPLSPTNRDSSEMAAFPALSPKPEIPLPGETTHAPCGRRETPTKPSASLAPLMTSASSLPHGLDLLATRPPPTQKPSSTPSPVVETHYIFARPIEKQRKHKTRHKAKGGQEETDQFLMLDPLFQSAPPAQPRRNRVDRAVSATVNPSIAI